MQPRGCVSVRPPDFQLDDVRLYLGDCLDVMRAMPAASIDTFITDPPYGLAFMGKEWDRLWDRRAGQRSFTHGDLGPTQK
ncbi:MAG: hypothetical protein IH987_04475 [Planctomycetes bacterium]|nr:hypothetical protein [Planctomycetota bacterium]